ncbi:DUF427 domain-containing protein [Plantibacter sp. Mn2098]|uniref:DUF427 domain-containing protein n=1 Tax=Plantibacter sp. Mn2098 TaxID=3395266 RepID=UPI003BC670D2
MTATDPTARTTTPVPPRALPQAGPNLVARFEYPSTWSFSPSERWLRGVVGEVAIVDSRDQILVWEPKAKVPEYGFPLAQVRTDLLVETDAPPADRGFYRPRRPARTWYDLHVDGRIIRHAAWTWDIPELEGFIAVNWFHDVLDAWYEEDERVITHPRDPCNRVDALPSSRHVVVSHDGRVIADSTDAVLVFETGLPTRYYLPRNDVDLTALGASTTWSECPYKGFATDYWTLPNAEGVDEDAAWSYPDPKYPVAPIAGRIAFFPERVQITVDGVDVGTGRR